MRGFLAHKKGKAFAIGIALNVIVVAAILLGWLPADDPNTDENETMMAILALLGGANVIPLGFLGAQGYADGKSGGATATGATQSLAGLLLMLGLTVGCAAPAGVIKAHADMAKPLASLANQHIKMIDGLAISPADKLKLLRVAQTDIDAIQAIHQRVGEYLDATDVFDIQTATEWVEIGKQIIAAAGGDGGDD